jgi:aminocarboxymuconate-semialdehyde decarboxylase
MTIIDTHAHLVPPDLLTAIRAEVKHFPSVRLIELDGSLAFAFSGGQADATGVETLE